MVAAHPAAQGGVTVRPREQAVLVFVLLIPAGAFIAIEGIAAMNRAALWKAPLGLGLVAFGALGLVNAIRGSE